MLHKNLIQDKRNFLIKSLYLLEFVVKLFFWKFSKSKYAKIIEKNLPLEDEKKVFSIKKFSDFVINYLMV